MYLKLKDKHRLPASHKNCLMCTKLLSVDQDGNICEDVPAAQPVQVEKDITGVACKLYAAVCCAGHFVKFCQQNPPPPKTLICIGIFCSW